MKKILLVAIALTTVQTFAQNGNRELPNRERSEKMEQFKNMSAEDMAELRTKKMTLHLDLTESQQAKVYDIQLKNATVRKAKMEAMMARKESGEFKRPSQEERLAMQNARLDQQIAMKKKMKSILDEAQYAKWEKLQENMAQKSKFKNKKKHMKKQK